MRRSSSSRTNGAGDRASAQNVIVATVHAAPRSTTPSPIRRVFRRRREPIVASAKRKLVAATNAARRPHAVLAFASAVSGLRSGGRAGGGGGGRG